MTIFHLPTFVSASWTVTALRDSVLSSLRADKAGQKLSLFFYAVTEQGWREIRDAVQSWKTAIPNRQVIAYVGTDHAITEPAGLKLMSDDGVDVRLLIRYQGIFHPKVLWLKGTSHHSIWVGSNNLTREALLHNVEFSVQINSPTAPTELVGWVAKIDAASIPLDVSLLESYEKERRYFATSRAKVGTFTWTRKQESSVVELPVVHRGDLVIEIMPLETGLYGKQIQLPKVAAVNFFGLADRVGAFRQISLTMKGTKYPRILTMTIFANNSVRLSINELDYRDRPCMMVFSPKGNNKFEFEIVQRSIFPTRYNDLLKRCTKQTRTGSRRWIVIQ